MTPLTGAALGWLRAGWEATRPTPGEAFTRPTDAACFDGVVLVFLFFVQWVPRTPRPRVRETLLDAMVRQHEAAIAKDGASGVGW